MQAHLRAPLSLVLLPPLSFRWIHLPTKIRSNRHSPATVIPRRRTSISAHFSNRTRKPTRALLQQKQETPVPINTKGWRPPCGPIDYTDRNILAHFSNRKSAPFVPINTKKDSRPLSGNHYRFDLESQSNGHHYQYIGGLIQQKIIQESFTRNNIYKSREIIHFNAILQRAPQHHHSNIHTSITYTQSYAIKRMLKTKTKMDTKFKKWNSNNEDGAFLYVLFQERAVNPESYSAVTIYDHPLLNPIFKAYDRRNFNTHCKTAQKRESKHSLYGNVLDPDFKALVILEKVRRKDLLQQLLNPDGIDNSEEENDESYVNQSEDDLSFDADTEEASLSALLRNQSLDINHLRDEGNGAAKKTKKKTTTTRKKPAQPQAKIRKFCLFLISCCFYFVLFTNPIAIRVSILVSFFNFNCIASHRITEQQHRNPPYLLSVSIPCQNHITLLTIIFSK